MLNLVELLSVALFHLDGGPFRCNRVQEVTNVDASVLP
jgi:hypothetical protein